MADMASELGVKSRAHSDITLELAYGTLVPLRYMNADQHYKVICVCETLAKHYMALGALLVAVGLDSQLLVRRTSALAARFKASTQHYLTDSTSKTS